MNKKFLWILIWSWMFFGILSLQGKDIPEWYWECCRVLSAKEKDLVFDSILEVSGTIEDEAGTPLDGVTLKIARIGAKVPDETLQVSSPFHFSVRAGLAMQLKFTKDGYTQKTISCAPSAWLTGFFLQSIPKDTASETEITAWKNSLKPLHFKLNNRKIVMENRRVLPSTSQDYFVRQRPPDKRAQMVPFATFHERTSSPADQEKLPAFLVIWGDASQR